MSCVNSVSYVVLINGEPSSFFRRGKGVRQGCPLSPLLFILVMESLSILIKKEVEDGTLTGIKDTNYTKILQLLFFDDVLIMSRASVEERIVIAKVLKLFQLATWLVINDEKSTFHSAGLGEKGLMPFKFLYPYEFEFIDTGFKYMGYFLKLNCYKSGDWS